MGLRVQSVKKSPWSSLLHPPMAKLPAYSGEPTSQEDINKIAENAPPEQVNYNDMPDPNSAAAQISAWRAMGGKLPGETSGRIGEENKLGYDATRTTNTKNVTVTPTFASPEQMAQQRAQAEQAVGYSEQLAQQKALNDYIARVSLAKKPKVDLSPLMQLAGDWFGAQNLARGYKAPEGYKSADLVKYAQEQAKSRSELENQVVQNINAGKFPASQSILEDRLVEAIKALSAQKNPPPKSTTGQRGTQEKYIVESAQKIGKSYDKEKENFAGIDDALKNPSLQNIRVILGKVARAISGEGGRITNQDIGRAYPNTIGMSIAEFEGWLNSNPNEIRPTPAVTANLKNLVKMAKKRVEERHLSELNTFDRGIKNTQYEGLAPNAISSVREKILKDVNASNEENEAFKKQLLDALK